MKRGALLAIILTLLVIPAVSATVSITGPSRTQYNIGDTIDVTGYLKMSSATEGTLQFSLVCNNRTYSLQPVPFEATANEQVDFSDLSVPTITVSSSMQGLCRLNGKIVVSGATVEEDSSTSFEVTRDLEGTFEVDSPQLQLGDTLTFSGSVAQLDGDAVDGTAELYFVQGGTEYLIGFVDISNGALSYSQQILSGYVGRYTIDVIVRDGYGNEQSFASVADFTAYDELHVFINTNDDAILPGEHVNVYGSVETVTGHSVAAGSVELSLNGELHSASLDDSQYTYDLWAPSDIASGQHTIRVSVEDSYGNKGSAEVPLEIIPLATSVQIILSNYTLNPLEEFGITTTLYDQAGDQMDGDLALEVYDAKNKLVSERTTYSGEQVLYQIQQFASPGTWTIKSFVEDNSSEPTVIDEDSIIVNAVQKLDVWIEGDFLYIRNVGNVKYTDDFSIQVEGVEQEYLITKTKNLAVNDTIIIDLSEELPTGTYKVSIPTGAAVTEFDNVAIEEGTPRTSVDWLYFVVGILFVVLIALMVYRRFKGKTKKEEKKEEVPEDKPTGNKIKDKIKLHDSKKVDEKKKSKLNFGTREEQLADFKKRTLEEIQKTEQQAKKPLQVLPDKKLGEGKLGYVTGRRDAVDEKKEAPKPNPSGFSLFDD